MANTRPLPENPHLDHLRNEARSWQRRIRDGDQELRQQALDLAERDISGDFDQLPLSTAQWILARSYGYSSWPKLRERLAVITRFSRFPEATTDADESDADRLLRLGVLNYTHDRADQLDDARRLLADSPQLATANVLTMAATGRLDDLRRLLADDPRQARVSGGPHDWDPLLYLTSARITDDDHRAVGCAQLLLDAGADANSGYLWRGMTSPFTALTCALGGGEQDQPPHPAAIDLGRLLLEAGADPNDNQALYNRMFRPENDHLELLFSYGLGQDLPSVWRDRLGDSYPTPTQMLGEQLRWAAGHGFVDRVRLLLDHGVDPDNRGYHPNYGEQRAIDLAHKAGQDEIVQLLS